MNELSKDTLYLLPGEIFISNQNKRIITNLGSCVSIILFNQQHHLSTMCHALLPSKNIGGVDCFEQCPEPCYTKVSRENLFKYVNCSLRKMLDSFKEKKIPFHKIKAGLFGGANMFPYKDPIQTIGSKNIQMAKDLIKKYKLNLIIEDIGGNKGRTITFDTKTSHVKVVFH